MSVAGTARFITLEGGEGVGKSTQIELLAGRLRQAGLDIETTREPSGPIRDLLVKGDAEWDPRSEALMHFAARAEHLKNVVHPALARGAWVVCDRFADSTMAYQGVVQGAGQDFVTRLYDLVMGDFGPDLTLVMDMPVATGLARASARSSERGNDEDRYERMGTAFHEKLREAFLDIAAANPDRCTVIDAAQPVDEVSTAIWAAVSDRLRL
jgi:dTMP kinase